MYLLAQWTNLKKITSHQSILGLVMKAIRLRTQHPILSKIDMEADSYLNRKIPISKFD